MIIRKIKRADLPYIVELENNGWTKKTSPISERKKRIADLEIALERNTKILIAQEGQEIVAFLDYHPYYSFPSGKHVVTFGILVKREFHGKGIGKKLITSFFNEATREGYKKNNIHVIGSNQKAISFYKNLGFQTEARLKNNFFINNRYVTDIILGRELEKQDES